MLARRKAHTPPKAARRDDPTVCVTQFHHTAAELRGRSAFRAGVLRPRASPNSPAHTAPQARERSPALQTVARDAVNRIPICLSPLERPPRRPRRRRSNSIRGRPRVAWRSALPGPRSAYTAARPFRFTCRPACPPCGVARRGMPRTGGVHPRRILTRPARERTQKGTA